MRRGYYHGDVSFWTIARGAKPNKHSDRLGKKGNSSIFFTDLKANDSSTGRRASLLFSFFSLFIIFIGTIRFLFHPLLCTSPFHPPFAASDTFHAYIFSIPPFFLLLSATKTTTTTTTRQLVVPYINCNGNVDDETQNTFSWCTTYDASIYTTISD